MKRSTKLQLSSTHKEAMRRYDCKLEGSFGGREKAMAQKAKTMGKATQNRNSVCRPDS